MTSLRQLPLIVAAVTAILITSSCASTQTVNRESVGKGVNSHNTDAKVQRETMARKHEQMAACLRSDRDEADCRKQMMPAMDSKDTKPKCEMMQQKGDEQTPSPEHKH